MSELVRGILLAEPEELDCLQKALQQRYSELFPDWEILTFSIHKNTDRNKQLDQIIELVEKVKQCKIEKEQHST